MKRISIILVLIIATSATMSSQTPWYLGKNEVPVSENPIIGTTNNHDLEFATNDTVRAVLQADGQFKLPGLAGADFQLVFVDPQGRLAAGPVGQDQLRSSVACTPRMLPWTEGGNSIGVDGSNLAGTCNNYNFILMANNQPQVHIMTTGKVGVGTNAPAGKFHVHETNGLGNTVGDERLLSSVTGIVNTNTFKSHTWLRRYNSSSGWTGAALHDGIAIDVSFGTPGVDSKTWWERRPADDVQLWGNGANTYMRLSQGNLYIGPQIPNSTGSHANARLSVDGKVLAKELFINIQTATWADYVFEQNYDLLSLPEVEKFIKKNKHLPNVPSGQDLTSEEYNLNVAEMQKMQMEKIEEAFLHLIALQKEIELLKEENKRLREVICED